MAVKFYVKLLKPKKKRSSEEKENWPIKGTKYPVLHVEVEQLDQKFDPTAMQHPLSDPMYSLQQMQDGGYQDLDLDEEDEEELERIFNKARKKQTEVNKVRTWLLIGNAKNGMFRWVTTEEVKFVCT